jgi:hypothetical protein
VSGSELRSWRKHRRGNSFAQLDGLRTAAPHRAKRSRKARVWRVLKVVGVVFACVVNGLPLEACQMVAGITDRTLASESNGGAREGTGGTTSSQLTGVNSEGGGASSGSGGAGGNLTVGGTLTIGGSASNGGSGRTGGTLATGGSTSISTCVVGNPENCTDGIDNNCDGLIDCADSTCRSAGYECIAVPPGWLGPVAIWQGSPGLAPQNCAAGLQVAMESVYRDLNVPSSACSCACASATSQNCGSATVTFYSNNVCGDECGRAEVSASQCGTVVNGGTCGATFTASAIAPIPNGGSCTPQVVSSIPKATWNTELLACAAANSAGAGGCNESNSRCLIAPNPGAPYQTARCVYKVADPPVTSCPADYTKGPSVFYAGMSDTRVCSGCTCGTPTGGTCSGTISVYYRPRCEGTPLSFTIGQDCQEVNLVSGTASTIVGDFKVNKAGTCTTGSDAMLSGNVQGTGAVTVCCAT